MTLPAIYANIRDFYDRTFWQTKEFVVQHGDGYLLGYSGYGWLNGGNQLWIDDAAGLTPALIDEALRFFRPYLAEWSLLIIPEIFPELKERVLEYGGFVRWSNPVMLLEGVLDSRHDSDTLRIERVRGEAARSMTRRVMIEAFHTDNVLSRLMVQAAHELDDTFRHYLAYLGNHPAAAATMTYTDNMAGIWNVGTRRMFRRRGLAHALMAHLCSEALADGHPQTALMASHQGYPMYLNMGYQVVAEGIFMSVPYF